jgi:hypothetical protein
MPPRPEFQRAYRLSNFDIQENIIRSDKTGHFVPALK